MSMVDSASRRIVSGAGIELLSDQELVRRISREKDCAALDLLVVRYQVPAFSLAFRLIGNAAEAEDAVQEALLGVWLSAPNFRSTNVRKWILAIVARKALFAIRRRRALTVRERKVCESRGREESETAACAVETREYLEALRGILDELPAETSQLLLLYFGAQLSQDEIAAQLGLPQTTISRRLNKALESLRGRLARMGLATGAPLLVSGTLAEAFTTGLSAPAGLRRRVLERLPQAKRGALGSGRLGLPRGRIRRMAGSNLRWALPLCLGFVALAVAVQWGEGVLKPGVFDAPRETRALTVSGSPAPAFPQTQASPTSVPFVRTWNFNTAGQARDFKQRVGRWHWVAGRGPDGSGCMETDTELFLAVWDVPTNLKDACFLVESSCQFTGVRTPGKLVGTVGVLWDEVETLVEMKSVRQRFGRSSPYWLTPRSYLSNEIMDFWTEGHRSSLCLARKGPGANLKLEIRGRALFDDLTIRAIPAQELPDVSAYRAAVERIPPALRHGVVALRGLESAGPPLPVQAIFHLYGAAAAAPGQAKLQKACP